MKRVAVLCSLLAILVCFTTYVYAVPDLMSYQGVLNDDGGNSVEGTYSMTFRIWDAKNDGNILWNETQSVQVSNGIFNVQLGAVTSLPYSIFSNDTLYLGVKVGTDSEMEERQRITSGAYSFKSATEDMLWSQVFNLALDIEAINQQLATPLTLSISDSILHHDYIDTTDLSGTV